MNSTDEEIEFQKAKEEAGAFVRDTPEYKDFRTAVTDNLMADYIKAHGGEYSKRGLTEAFWHLKAEGKLLRVPVPGVTPDTLITLSDGSEVKAQDLKIGVIVRGLGVDGNRVIGLEPSLQNTVQLTFSNGKIIDVSCYHGLSKNRGWIRAWESLGRTVRTLDGDDVVVESLKNIGLGSIIKIKLDGDHSYLSNGIWSLE
jgi:hypothetical protein